MTEQVESDSLFLVGHVWRAHGVQGDVKVIPETDDPARLSNLSVVYLGITPTTASRRRVESMRLQPTKRGPVIIMKLEGVDTREQVDSLRRSHVFARESDLPPLDEDEYFVHDLVGLQVFIDTDEFVGRVEDVMMVPAQDILVVSREGKESVMIPIVQEFVVDIDIDAGRIVIQPIEGLLD